MRARFGDGPVLGENNALIVTAKKTAVTSQSIISHPSSGSESGMSIGSKDCCLRCITDYDSLHRDRRTKLEKLRTGDGRDLGPYLKAQLLRELDRVELLLRQITAVEGARSTLLTADSESQTVRTIAGNKASGNQGYRP